MSLSIEVISDIVCPWCYIGKRRLDAALKEFADPTVAVLWKPFQLTPELPPEGVDRKAYMEKKFGAESAREMQAHITELGRADGIDFQFERIEYSPNTFHAHRLIWNARQEGHQDTAVEALFRAYFIEGRNIGDQAVLADIGREIGISEDRLHSFTQRNEGAEETKQEISEAYQRGITLVPYFTINQDHWIEGADTVETFVQAFRMLSTENAGSYA